jgi:hypothetical protein
MKTEPERYFLTIEAMRGNWLANPTQRLRRILKALARGYGFRCVHCAPAPVQDRKLEQKLKPGKGVMN